MITGGENSVLNDLQKLLPNLQSMDIATGVFEIGSFLLLEGLWQELGQIRILMGDETTRRTKREIVRAMLQTSNNSIDQSYVIHTAQTAERQINKLVWKNYCRKNQDYISAITTNPTLETLQMEGVTVTLKKRKSEQKTTKENVTASVTTTQ